MPFRVAVLALALLAAWPQAGVARSIGRLEFKPCDLQQAGQYDVVQAECGKLTVPEDPAAPAGRQITLRLALVASKAAQAEPDPVFFLAGGPGQSALDSYPSMARAYRRILEHRHVILMDQRGTGGSHPLECKFEGETPLEPSGSARPEAVAARVAACAAKLDADPRHYTTEDAVRDLEAIRVALGADKIDLVGGSYGTRLAQHYLRRHPEHTRAVILDGVAPPALALGSEHALNLQAALDGIAARCAGVPACQESFGDMRGNLELLRAQVVREPREYEIRDPLSGAPLEQRFNLEALVTVARIFAYAPETAALLPYTLHEALQGRPEPLLEQGRLIAAGLGEQITRGLELSVICAEDADLMQENPADRGTLMGPEFVALLKAGCAAWPKGTRAADFHEPLKSDVPALLLSGEFDPVTPPRYGEEARKGLSRSRHLIAKGQGHMVMMRGCMPRIAADFLKSADPDKLDIKCLDQLGNTPAFVGANGWEP